MSGSSDEMVCPKCGENLLTNEDRKPHDCVSGECLNCGFGYHTVDYQASLTEVNERREDHGLAPLKKLKAKV